MDGIKRYFADHVWMVDGWHVDVAIDIDASGHFAALVPRSQRGDREHLGRWVVPGVPNLHSHAFQRAMAGLAERRGHTDSTEHDSFWTWREVMYAFAQAVDPDSLQAIAAQLYVEMLEAGYTHVCEFHYLHHAPDGRPYDDPAAMSKALLTAADEVGIGMTLLPALYMTGGFDGRALSPRQQRFHCEVEQYLRLLQSIEQACSPGQAAGLCFHSLRAVPEAAMRAVLEGSPEPRPVHIHVAEQQAEVLECMATRGRRPVQWLLDEMPLDPRWTLVHATHIDESEIAGMAMNGVVAGLCPTTEGNLGDGLFPLEQYMAMGGRFGIGSDSHVSVSLTEELRWLEYGQRLQLQRRNIAYSPHRGTGEALLTYAIGGGAQAASAPIGWFEEADVDASAPGSRADLIVLDEHSPALIGRDRPAVIDSWLFSSNRPAIRHVMVGGEWRVRDAVHPLRDQIAARYAKALGSMSE